MDHCWIQTVVTASFLMLSASARVTTTVSHNNVQSQGGAPLWLAESDNPDDFAYIEENPDSAFTALALSSSTGSPFLSIA